MSADIASLSREEVARLGKSIYANQIEPVLQAGDLNRYVAIDVESGSFEIDSSDYEAVSRVRKRCPTGRVWLMRVGHRTAGRI